MAIGQDLEQYFVDISTGCPYGLEQKSVYHQAMFTSLDDAAVGHFLENGYRRNGNCMYAMHCPSCSSCVPVRIRPESFRPNRNQRRVWKKNRDVTVGVAPLTMSGENLTLLDRFLQARFPDGKSTAESYYTGFFITSVTHCFEIRYRIGDQLLGVAIVDGSEQWMNAVYFFFDPDQGGRSPGTLNVLYLIDFCHNHGIDPLYLGYWIDDVPAMQYKAAFKPQEIFIEGSWQEISRS
ncbi:MAG: arginyltransferase [Desulfobulbaceae bacterium]|nr:arginyltransferase [Desulfobulbaceae bacterium]